MLTTEERTERKKMTTRGISFVYNRKKNENTLKLIRSNLKENEVKRSQNILSNEVPKWKKKPPHVRIETDGETGEAQRGCRKEKPRVKMNYKKENITTESKEIKSFLNSFATFFFWRISRFSFGTGAGGFFLASSLYFSPWCFFFPRRNLKRTRNLIYKLKATSETRQSYFYDIATRLRTVAH